MTRSISFMTNLRMKRDGKSDLNEISSAFDKALKKRVQWEKEASNLKGELNNMR